MAKEYVKLWLSYEAYFEPLGAAEVGRLALAMMKYKSQGVEPVFTGNERFVWPAIKRDIDEANQAAADYSERQSANGKKGGRPRKSEDDGKANESQKTQPFLQKPKKGMDKGLRTMDNSPPISPNGDNPPSGGDLVPDQTPKARPKPKSNAGREAVDAWTQDPELRELLYEWLEVRKAQRAANTAGAIGQNLKKLPDLAQESGLSMQEYLREVIRRSWRAFYPIRDYQGGQIAAPARKDDGRGFDWLTGQ